MVIKYYISRAFTNFMTVVGRDNHKDIYQFSPYDWEDEEYYMYTITCFTRVLSIYQDKDNLGE